MVYSLICCSTQLIHNWWPKRPEVEFGLAPIFAAGRVFTTSILDTLVCQAFYNASIPMIIQELVRGKAPIRHTLCPNEFVGKSYSELFHHLLEEEALVAIAVYANQDSTAAHEMISSDVTAEGSKKKRTGRLQRLPSANNPTEGFDEMSEELLPVIVTNPAPKFVLSAGDLILVIPSNDPTAAQTVEQPLVSTPTVHGNTVV